MPTCDCGYESPTERGLSIHQTRSHGDTSSSAKKEYECAECGSLFNDYPSRRETRGREIFFCSKQCKNEHQRVEKFKFSCSQCGSTVERTESAIGSMGDYSIDNHFCDKECESEWKSENWVGEKHPSWKDNTQTMSCDQCDSNIEVLQYYVGKLDHHFCDKNCHADFARGETHDSCELCGTTFELSPRQRSSNAEVHFCSKAHWSEWISNQQCGENNSSWSGGRETYYGPNWNEARNSVLERDDFRCKNCGCTQKEHYNRVGFDLDVHHIDPLRTFDDNYSDANDPSNLITLCRRCHPKAESGVIDCRELLST